MMFRFVPKSHLLCIVTALFVCGIVAKFALAVDETNASILFVGDSDIQYWKKKTNQKFPNSTNRGNGGTTCKHWVNKIDKFLKKDAPTTVVLVCGENDLYYNSPATAFSNFKKIVNKIAAQGATTIYMGTKPEPGTKSMHAKYRKYDALIREYYDGSQQEALIMVDVYPSFVDLGNPDYFYRNDDVHLSGKGYSYWTEWLTQTLNDNTGCILWESGTCSMKTDNNENNDESTPDPTSDPSTFEPSTFEPSCSDDSEFLWRGKKSKDCDWIGERTKLKKWCNKSYKKTKVNEWCPEACGEC